MDSSIQPGPNLHNIANAIAPSEAQSAVSLSIEETPVEKPQNEREPFLKGVKTDRKSWKGRNPTAVIVNMMFWVSVSTLFYTVCFVIFAAFLEQKLAADTFFSDKQWALTFAPLFVGQAMYFFANMVTCIRVPYMMRSSFVPMVNILSLFVFEVFMCLKLDKLYGFENYLWTVLFTPLFFLAINQLVAPIAIHWSDTHVDMQDGETKKTGSGILHKASAVYLMWLFSFLAIKLDNFISWDWATVFIPLFVIGWVLAAVSCFPIITFFACRPLVSSLLDLLLSTGIKNIKKWMVHVALGLVFLGLLTLTAMPLMVVFQLVRYLDHGRSVLLAFITFYALVAAFSFFNVVFSGGLLAICLAVGFQGFDLTAFRPVDAYKKIFDQAKQAQKEKIEERKRLAAEEREKRKKQNEEEERLKAEEKETQKEAKV